MTHTIPWRHSTQSLPLVHRNPPPPVLHQTVDEEELGAALVAARERQRALVAALRDVVAMTDDHSQHTHDRLLLARMRAAEALRGVGIEPAPTRSRLT